MGDTTFDLVYNNQHKLVYEYKLRIACENSVIYKAAAKNSEKLLEIYVCKILHSKYRELWIRIFITHVVRFKILLSLTKNVFIIPGHFCSLSITRGLKL